MSSKSDSDSFNRLPSLGFFSGSIATHLAFWFTVLSVCLIFVVGAALYVSMESHLHKVDSRMIKSMLREIGGHFNEYSYDSDLFKEELEHEFHAFKGLHVVIEDLNGNVLLEEPVEIEGFHGHVSHTEHHLWKDNVVKEWISENGDTYLVIKQKVSVPGEEFILWIGMNRTDQKWDLAKTFGLTLILATLCAVMLAIALGRLIALRSTQPINHMSSLVSNISVKELNQRVSDEDWPSELKPLAEEFDQLLSRLEASFQHVEQFSADIAHEFRTSLHILRGEAEMTLMTIQDQEQYRKVIESSMEEYQHLSQMVESLLLLARMDHSGGLLKKDVVDVEKEIRSVCEYFQALAEDNGICLECAGEGSVFADGNLLRRAVSNLISNSICYTPSGGKIMVEAKELANHDVEISVTDTGIGIAADQIPRVFDRFYRCDKARSRQERLGFGLGLAIVKAIMSLHDGMVEISSEFGSGSRVVLRFPARAGD